jgi:hypothetical protein
MAAFVRISFAKYFVPIVATKRKMEFSVPDDLVSDPEVVHYFKATRLKALALRADEVDLGLIDNPECHTSAGEITSQGQSGGTGSYDQHLNVNLCCHE